ncbi:gamma-glutamylcyclotransferase [Bordetella genomosp. 10]|uniref:glutathione-specific gamma-glutamylcyclotransferase n=1 Tax=Bordetella genomosp. 10 TaxID=1416804 RepID=A0A261SLX8_9BORD|nr:gamma-glutamylcyclotransferase [Bordetella genomosp. 10]
MSAVVSELACIPAQMPEHDSLDSVLRHWNGVDDLWVFAYGSLIWRPGFAWQERRITTVKGYHRSLCLWSHHHRGSREIPGLVFGLDRGGCCRGVAFRVAAADVPVAFAALWEREMIDGAYTPRWLNCHGDAGCVSGLVFVLNRGCANYAGELTEESRMAAIRTAVGRSGACLEYVVETDRALRDNGIEDCRLGALVRRLMPAY